MTNMSKMWHQSSYKLQKALFEYFLLLNRNLLCRNDVTGLRRVSPVHSAERYGYSSKYQGLRLFSSGSRETWRKFGTKRVKDGKEKVKLPADAPASPRSYFPYWARWAVGSILTVLPFSSEKWAKLQTIEGEAEMVIEKVENAAEIVEKVATVAEKVSLEVADKLPVNGKLKETALFVERVSKKASQDARLTIDFIHKVDEFKHDIEDLETLVEPIDNPKHETQAKNS